MTLNSVAETLNGWGSHFIRFVWPVFWQSSLLITAMFMVDFVARRRLRPSVRYALWLIVLAKLLLPPSLAFPTGAAWWLRAREVLPVTQPTPNYIVTYGPSRMPVLLPNLSYKVHAPPEVRLSPAGWALVGACSSGLALLTILLGRWRRLRRELRQSGPTPIWLTELLARGQCQARYRRRVRIVLTDASISPALWGFFRPVIVLPTTLVDRLGSGQLRAVLLHELFHLRNGDVWINCFQSFLQIVYWWHPLLWFANARIRRVREEAVDDAVRLALGEEAETYPTTLLEVARLALARPLATLGLVGILESRHALRQRVERLINFPAPRRAGVTLGSLLGILAFTCVAVPMGQAPPKRVEIVLASNSKIETQKTDQPPTVNGHNPAWEIQPLNQQGWAESDLRSGIAEATNGAVVKYADAIVTADRISLNQQTKELVADGSVRIQTGVRPSSAALHSTLERQSPADSVQIAQYQASTANPAQPQIPGGGRRRILSKLEAIRLNNVAFDNLPLNEVVNYLSNESKKRDPEGKGINFILMPYVGATAPGAIDPATGEAIAQSQGNIDDLSSVSIRLPLPLNDVRMVDVLDAIIKVADRRIRYSIEEYGVSFRLTGNEPSPSPLFTRSIKVDPGVFAQGLESVVGFSVGNFQTGGQGGGGGQQNGSGITIPRVQVAPNAGAGQGGQGGAQGGGGGISGVTRPTTMISPQAVKQFFVNTGVDLTPPKSIFYNDRSGTLMVHATMEDIDTIERAIGGLAALSTEPQTARQNEAGSKPVSSQANQTKAPVLGDLPTLGKGVTRTVEVAAASSPISAAPSPQINIKVKFVEIPKGDTVYFLSALKELRIQNPSSGAVGTATSTSAELNSSFAEVLTDQQFRDLLVAVEQREGADLLNEAAVTTLSGRQAQIQIVDMKTILVKINPEALIPPGVSATNLFVTENLPVGPVLDVIPVVGDDCMTVSLDVTATLTTFIGYDTPEKGDEEQVYVDGKVKSMKPPHPRIRVRQMHHEVASLTDGQTLMLGNPKDTMIAYYKDEKKVDEPGTEKKDLLVFVTTTLIDPSGNPIHTSIAPGQK